MYVLDKKSSVGFGMRSIARGDIISEDEFKSLPERVKPFFKKVESAEQSEKENVETVSVADAENPEEVKNVSPNTATQEEAAAIAADSKDNFRATGKKKRQKK